MCSCIVLNVQASCQLSFGYNFLLLSTFSVLVSHLHIGESHAGVVLILCVLNLALFPPTDSFTK